MKRDSFKKTGELVQPSSSLPLEKAGLRQRQLSQLRGLNSEVRQQASLHMGQVAAEWPGFQQAGTLALFASLKTEPETGWLLAEAWAQNKRVVLPRCQPEGRLSWHQVRAASEIERWEPKASCPLIPVEELEAVLVPGLAFDHRGHRLGRGGGYYDRFLATLPDTVACAGLMFSWQQLPELPVEPHDVPLRCVLTETGPLFFPPA